MMKYIMFAIKIIPIITICQGVISGGARMGPFVDTIKVAFTQYEVVQISKALVSAKGPMVTPDKFSDFIRENYYSQYSVLAREIKGDKEHDHAIDVWGKPFQLVHVEGSSNVKVASAGPDGLIGNKDDVAVTIEVSAPHKNPLASAHKKKKKMVEVVPVENQASSDQVQQNGENNPPPGSEENREPSSTGEHAEEAYDQEGYDQEGYNQSGFNRDGYNREG
ncbi:MAG: hypothetical protein ACXVLQ_17215, partial [Bacteriovorax sp.]